MRNALHRLGIGTLGPQMVTGVLFGEVMGRCRLARRSASLVLGFENKSVLHI